MHKRSPKKEALVETGYITGICKAEHLMPNYSKHHVNAFPSCKV